MSLSKSTLHSFALVMALTGLTGCGFMHDDLPDCPVKPEVRTSVSFEYDYNTGLSDRFSTDIGAVTLYVFDEAGHLVAREERTNAHTGNALKADGFEVSLSLQPGEYQVYAVAHGNHGGNAAALKLPGAKFRIAEPTIGEDLSRFRVNLDHNGGLVDNAGVMLDTLWSTRSLRTLSVPEVEEPKEGDPQPDDIEVKAKLPLMRLTNHLTLSFYHKDFPMNTDHSNYEVWVESRKGRDSFDIFGNYFEEAQPLRYTPFKSRTGADNAGHNCGFREFGLPRFIMHENDGDRTLLCFRNKSTGNVTQLDLAKLLAKGKDAYAQYNWSEQEYLDREYDYEMQVVLDDYSWQYAIVSINILSWSKRIQNENL